VRVGDLVQHVTNSERVGIVTNIDECGRVTGVWLYEPPKYRRSSTGATYLSWVGSPFSLYRAYGKVISKGS
jgi:hypothetical protein